MNLKRNLTLLTGLALLQGMVFYSPVATLYRVENGLSLSDFFLIEALSWALTLASEVPWGLAADRLGVRRTLVWGHGLLLATKVVFALASGFGGFLAERLLLAVAAGAVSGADSALVFRSSGPGDSTRAFARIRAAGLAGLVVAALVGPVLAAWGLRWTAWATVVPYALAWGLSWFLRDPGRLAPRPLVWRREARRTVLAFGRLFGRGWGWPLALAALALAGEVTHLVLVFLAQLQYRRAAIPEGAFGLLFLGLQVVPMAVLALVPAGFGRRPRRTLAWLTALGAGLVLVLAAQADPVVSVLALAALAVTAQVQGPVVQSWENASIRGGGRATTLSVYALWSEAAAGGGNLVLGSVPGAGDQGGLVPLLVTAAVLLALAAGILAIPSPPTRRPSPPHPGFPTGGRGRG